MRILRAITAAIEATCRMCRSGQVNEFDGVKYCTRGCTYR